jgi:hypothetical protein
MRRFRGLAAGGLVALAGAGHPANTAIEFQHILACQYTSATHPADGAINNVWGGPTWVVPGENAVVAWVLHRGGYTAQARRCADYLARIQNPDGSWDIQYSGTVSVDSNRHARHAAQIMHLFATLGGYATPLANAHRWLHGLTLTTTKGGADDGLIGGGFDAVGTPLGDRWTSDNAYAALAFHVYGDFATRDRVVAGINSLLRSGDHWVRYRTAGGVNVDPDPVNFGWIQFAPAFLNLRSLGVVYPAGLAQGIRARLMEPAGPDAGAVREFGDGPLWMPGIGFQASIAWRALGDQPSITAHTAWAENVSGLWQTTPDGNNDIGGWIDWTNTATGADAPGWQRFIDTSAYYIMAVNGWTFVDDPKPPPPPLPKFDAPVVVYPNPAAGDIVTIAVRPEPGDLSVVADVYNAGQRRVWTGGWALGPRSPASRAVEGVLGWAPGPYRVRVRITRADGSVRTPPAMRLVVKR